MLRLPCVVFDFDFGLALAAIHVLLTLPKASSKSNWRYPRMIKQLQNANRLIDSKISSRIVSQIAMSVITLHVSTRDGHAIIRLSHSHSQWAKDDFSMLCDFLRKFKHMLLHTWLGFRRRTMTIHAHKTVAHSLPFLRVNLVTWRKAEKGICRM